MRFFNSLPAVGFLVAALALGIGMADAKQSNCSRDDIARAALATRSAQTALLNLPVDPEFNALVPAEAQQAIAAMKDRLRDLVAAYMSCAGHAPNAQQIERDLADLVPATTAAHRTVHTHYPIYLSRYGDQLAFEARIFSAGRRLVSIVVRFQIPCGQDAALFILQQVDGAWKEALRWQSKRYSEISDAFMEFDYAIVPPDKARAWSVATKYVTPWCTSNWRSIRYAVLQPTADNAAPAEVLSGDDGVYLDGEDFGRLTADRNSFTLRFHGSSIDPEIHNRVWIRRFRRAAGPSFVRVPPIALAPVDFVDEWIVSPWSAAQAWSSQPEAQGLEFIHDRLHERQPGVAIAVLSLHRCHGRNIRHQVALQIDGLGTQYFFVGGAKAFVLQGVASTSDPMCAGSNLLHRSNQ